MGNKLSHRCKRASSGRGVNVLMIMAGHGGGGRECERRTRKRNPLLLEELYDAGHVRADDCGFGDHQRLVPIADVVGEQPPLLGRTWLDRRTRATPPEGDADGPRLL